MRRPASRQGRGYGEGTSRDGEERVAPQQGSLAGEALDPGPESVSEKPSGTAGSAQTAVRRAADTTARAAKSAAETTSRAAKSTAETTAQAVPAAVRLISESARKGAASTVAAAQALLASDMSGGLNKLADAALSGPATIYDKALDARYIDPVPKPGLGGSDHRLFDGGHTIVGAAKAVHTATHGDTILQEAAGTVQALLKDAATPRGLPMLTWDKSTFDSVAATLAATLGIPKRWLYELNTYDIADLLGATVGVVAVVFGWNRADTETFSQLAASTAVSAATAVNPLFGGGGSGRSGQSIPEGPSQRRLQRDGRRDLQGSGRFGSHPGIGRGCRRGRRAGRGWSVGWGGRGSAGPQGDQERELGRGRTFRRRPGRGYRERSRPAGSGIVEPAGAAAGLNERPDARDAHRPRPCAGHRGGAGGSAGTDSDMPADP